jgi:hypothetical protein
MNKKSGLNKTSRAALAVVATLCAIGLLFALRGYLAENFGIEADVTTEKLLFKKTATNGDFVNDTASSTIVKEQTSVDTWGGVFLYQPFNTGTISSEIELPRLSTVTKIVLGTKNIDSSCLKSGIRASFSEDKSTYTEEITSSNSVTLDAGSVKAKYVKYAVTLEACKTGDPRPGITSLSVLGYTGESVSNPPTPADITGDIDNPPTPDDPTSSATASASATATAAASTTATSTVTQTETTPSSTSTTVASSQVFGNPQESVKSVALSGIQSGISFWSLVALVGAVGALAVIRIIKSKD